MSRVAGTKPIGWRTSSLRRGGRAVEGARLERVYTGNRIKGSNPFLSAIYILLILLNYYR